MPSLTELFERSNISFKRHGEHHHSGKGWVSIDCPRCSPGWGKYRLGFHVATGRSNCWVCGAVDGVKILSELCGISLKEGAALLRQPGLSESIRPIAPGRLVAPQAGDLLPAHRNYLESRGFDPDEIVRVWGVKGIGIHSKLPWRLFIPIHDVRGRVVSWTTRSINPNASLRYVSASPEEEAVPHKTILYGAHLARHTIIVCEGPISAWGIGVGAVATLGLGYTQEQLNLMAEYPIRVVCFDSEPQAQKRAEALCRELAAFPGRTENVMLETGADPAEADKEEILELRRQFL